MRYPNGWGGRGARQRGTGPIVLNRASAQAQKLAMWVPITPGSAVQRDVVTGAVFTPQGDAADIASVPTLIGGHALLQNSGSAPFSYYEAGSVFGVGASGQTFAVVLPPHSVAFQIGGALIKVGNSSTGVGLGLGGSDFDSQGSNVVVAFEAIRWVPTSVAIDRTRTNVIALSLPAAGGGVQIYLNGLLILNDTSGSPNTATTSTGLMGYGSRSPWAAACEFRLWNRAFSASEHWALYAPQTRFDLYWTPSTRVYEFYGAGAAPPAGTWGPLLGGARHRLVVAA